ncbi:FAD-dependent oxidoreductase [Magnetovibrio sp. PR-2]|uniref:FAD-dependent oxidoreductase n=1 Tax=Magnetovibrio sp. PR-2 TaxID=3120356 RepID=UPI002FCE0E51
MNEVRRTSVTAAPDLRDDTGNLHYVPAPCQTACPVGTDVPSYIAHIWNGDVEAAFEAITATNPLSSICGRVCDAPCEPACRREDSDGAIAIRNLKRFVLDQLGDEHALPPVEVTQSGSVAVVGGGPAGLTAAQDLAEAGYAVHIYEASDKLGGMAVWGIPRFRLPAGAIDADIDRMLKHCPGIEVHLNTPLGPDLTLDDLKAKHDAVVLTIGATQGKTLGLDGKTRDDVIDGVGFLRRINAGERPELPETVLVVGGGDVAMDACRAAKRMPGVKDVKVVYRRGPEEMPARRDELKGALAEDIDILYNTQPVAIADKDGLALRCVKTELGEADADGRRRPVTIEGSEHDLACGLIITAVGQKADSAELDAKGLMDWDRVKTDFATMQTQDSQVFAAGDGAFGGSSIVEAMHHGHRVAYYVKAKLQGRDNPLPYQTPYRTRAVEIAQDANWETTPRIEQTFLGLGDNPTQFDEIEVTYTLEQAKCEAARCFRCDAETGSADYTVQARENVFKMARTAPMDAATQKDLLQSRLANREDPLADARGGHFDDLVFLPANLTRLVIDPYREHCVTKLDLANIILGHPVIVSGLDTAPDDVRSAVTQGLADTDTAYFGDKPLEGSAWIQPITTTPSAEADMAVMMDITTPPPARAHDTQGLAARATIETVEAVIDYALANGLDAVVLDGMNGLSVAKELDGAPELSLISKAIAHLRSINQEESIDLIWFGGVRTGTDVAKLLAMGANAAIIGAAFGFGIGGHVTDAGELAFERDLDRGEREERARDLITAFSAECSMMAKCTGKTNVHNLEPEDLRALTLETAKALSLPLPGHGLSGTDFEALARA